MTGARAQDAGPTSGWSFQLTPYLWLAGISGDVAGPRGNTASFDAGIGDVLGHLQGGLMVLGEARYRNVETYSTGMKQRAENSQKAPSSPGNLDASLSRTLVFISTIFSLQQREGHHEPGEISLQLS